MTRRTGWLSMALVASMSLVASGCSDDDDGTLSAATTAVSTPNPAATAPTVTIAAGRRVTWNNVTFTLPAAWQDSRGRDGFAAGPRIYDYKGYAIARLNAVAGFDGVIDDLIPKVCLRQASNVTDQPTAVSLQESGFAPVGDRTAQFRRWSATCPAGPEEHRAWVLPVSRIAIYEVCHDNDTVAVASTATVVDLVQPAPASRPPWPNEIPSSCRNDLTDSATGT